MSDLSLPPLSDLLSANLAPAMPAFPAPVISASGILIEGETLEQVAARYNSGEYSPDDLRKRILLIRAQRNKLVPAPSPASKPKKAAAPASPLPLALPPLTLPPLPPLDGLFPRK